MIKARAPLAPCLQVMLAAVCVLCRFVDSGPVSQLVSYHPSKAISVSYDMSVRVWDVSGPQAHERCCLLGHTAPVLEMVLQGEKVATGGRDGTNRGITIKTQGPSNPRSTLFLLHLLLMAKKRLVHP